MSTKRPSVQTDRNSTPDGASAEWLGSRVRWDPYFCDKPSSPRYFDGAACNWLNAASLYLEHEQGGASVSDREVALFVLGIDPETCERDERAMRLALKAMTASRSCNGLVALTAAAMLTLSVRAFVGVYATVELRVLDLLTREERGLKPSENDKPNR